MKYLYWDRIIVLKSQKYLLEWCDGEPFIQNIATGEKTFIEMHNVSKFSWIKNKVKYTLKIQRETRRPSKTKAWNGYKEIEVEECYCTLSTEKI